MKKVLSIDPDAMTVTVEACVVWEKLDKELAKHGLTLQLYPSSYPSATVGGWLAQGGAGIGSFEFGWFHDNLVSARVVLPNGEVRDFNGSVAPTPANFKSWHSLLLTRRFLYGPYYSLTHVWQK